MKKKIVIYSLLTSCILAGGDIEEVFQSEYFQPTENRFYIGLSTSSFNMNDDFTDEKISSNDIGLLAGYKFNDYFAVEGRASMGLNMDYNPGMTGNNSSDYDGDYTSWGIYLKPMYPIDDFRIYGLIGFGGTQLSNLENGDAYENSFQWGLGAEYNIHEDYAIFVDYVKAYDDTGFDYRAQNRNVEADKVTVGLYYKF